LIQPERLLCAPTGMLLGARHRLGHRHDPVAATVSLVAIMVPSAVTATTR